MKKIKDSKKVVRKNRPRKPRRPGGLREIGFDSYEFQLIGEIVVLCGLIEQLLRDLPIFLIKQKQISAYAFTAHLTFQSLCNLSLTMIQEYVTDADDRKRIETGIKRAAELFEERNRIVHGPFLLLADGTPGTGRFTARRQMRFQAHEYDRRKLVSLLASLIDVYEGLYFSVVWQKLEWFQQARKGD